MLATLEATWSHSRGVLAKDRRLSEMSQALPWLWACLSIALSACTAKQGDFMPPDLSKVKANLAFTCQHEADRIPARDPEAEQLYRHARWLVKNNRLKQDAAVYPQIERLIRIATAYGHDKANLELRDMIAQDQAHSEDAVGEMRKLVEDLVSRNIPGGFYDMGHYIESGTLGYRQDAELALKYYRKSADLGSPEGQHLVADKLAPIDAAPDVARTMRQCSAEQGHAEAAVALGNEQLIRKDFVAALSAFQLGVAAGSDVAAGFLSGAFNGPTPANELDYMAQAKDEERVKRYEAIGDVLSRYAYLHPRVPEINDIVPLPPAKLPPWDGKLKWLEEHKANLPPPLPSEARIAEMAQAKGLDPATGRPLPRSPR